MFPSFWGCFPLLSFQGESAVRAKPGAGIPHSLDVSVSLAFQGPHPSRSASQRNPGAAAPPAPAQGPCIRSFLSGLCAVAVSVAAELTGSARALEQGSVPPGTQGSCSKPRPQGHCMQLPLVCALSCLAWPGGLRSLPHSLFTQPRRLCSPTPDEGFRSPLNTARQATIINWHRLGEGMTRTVVWAKSTTWCCFCPVRGPPRYLSRKLATVTFP